MEADEVEDEVDAVLYDEYRGQLLLQGSKAT